MGSEFHRLVMVALAAGLLVIPGCGAGTGTTPTDGQGTSTPAAVQPKIVSAEVDGATSVRLTFSEAMKPATNVDPAKFRLTIGYYAKPGTATDKYTYQYYSGTYYAGKYGSYAHYYSNVGDVGGILAETSASTEAVLLMGPTFDVAKACSDIKAHGSSAGLYLHYSEKGSPTLEDTSGNALGSVAAFWDNQGGAAPAGASAPIPVTLHCN